MPEFDAIVIGTGQAGPSLARPPERGRQKVAIIERKLLRRHLRQHRLHPDQDAGRERLCGAPRAPRRRFRRTIDGPVSVDMKQVKARKDDVSRAARTRLERSLAASEAARSTGATRVRRRRARSASATSC